MKVVQLNVTCGAGSTGKICLAVSEILNEREIENYILYSELSSDYDKAIKYTDELHVKLQALKSKVLGNYGFNSKKITRELIGHLDKINPDVVHLHNLHGHNCNLEILFNYFKDKKIKLYWTFHDCWAFTGYCPHFDMVGCDKWQTKCESCPQKGSFSFFFDKSDILFEKKEELFSELDLTIITPSQWLADKVKQSFLKEYEVKVINNGIDLDTFKPRQSDFRQRYNLQDKFLILGVAFNWDNRKGLDVFDHLSRTLPKECQIVLVGADAKVKQLLEDRVIAIDRTADQRELSEIYTAADVFLNATREDTFPTVNIESLACGTPVITFDTGGSSEIIDEKSGLKVKKNDIASLEKAILYLKDNRVFSEENCRKRAEKFNMYDKFRQYANLYK